MVFKNFKRHAAFWIEKPVYPRRGSIVYCKLPLNAEHTGVFIGCNEIVELNSEGLIQIVGAKEFLNGVGNHIRLAGIAIYVACNEEESPLGTEEIARRAEEMVGHNRNYNLIFDNCHQFVCGCITGNFENPNKFFGMLEHEISNNLNNSQEVKWRNWEHGSL